MRLGFPAKVSQGLEIEITTLPGLGEHTESVLEDSGFSHEDIEALRNADVI